MTSKRAVFLMTLVMGAALVVGLLVVEGVVRAFLVVTDLPVTFYDPVTGPRVAPNQSGRWVIGDYIDSPYRFNRQEWHNAEDYVIPKPGNTVGVCMVGDSQIESLQVE